MFINVIYKDAPELSDLHRRSSTSGTDTSVERTLLVNPDCPVRLMLEYIRNKCKLGTFTQFDLSDAHGAVKGLFNMPTYANAKNLFIHKQVYYIIVMRQDVEKRLSVLPQLNHENRLYQELKVKVKRFLVTGEVTPPSITTTKATPPAKRSVIQSAVSKVSKKK